MNKLSTINTGIAIGCLIVHTIVMGTINVLIPLFLIAFSMLNALMYEKYPIPQTWFLGLLFTMYEALWPAFERNFIEVNQAILILPFIFLICSSQVIWKRLKTLNDSYAKFYPVVALIFFAFISIIY